MISRSLGLGLLAAACVAAAAGGAYVAVRQNAIQPAPQTVAAPAPPESAVPAQAVAETEAVVTPATPAAPVAIEREAITPSASSERAPETSNPPRTSRPPRAVERTTRRQTTTRSAPAPARTPATRDVTPVVGEPAPAAPADRVESAPETPRYTEPLAPPEPQFYEVTIPASSVIGLQIESSISTERAQVEDRVAARVTRDVMADGRVAIPAGSRVQGSVTLVEKGGKVKERARLGVRFHTLVLADGTELALRTEPIYREGESPAGDSSRKIGGAAVGGAILGAILGGGKGAVIGGATGAAGGTAAVMAGDRHAATLPTGTIVTVRLSSPVDVQVEGR